MEIKHRIDLVKLLPDRPVTVELGVAQGLFSRDICEYWNPKHHFAVDNWGIIDNTTGDGNFPQEWHNMNYHTAIWKMYDYRHKVTFLKGITWEQSRFIEDQSVDIVYVDAGHTFEAVSMDIKSWFPKLKEGGVMAFHDFGMPQYGVKQAVESFCQDRYDIYPIPEHKFEDSGAFFIKL